MGLYDRDYSRDEPWAQKHSWTPGSEMPSRGRSDFQGPWSITTVLIVCNVIVFLLDMVLTGRDSSGDRLPSFMATHFSVEPDTLLKPWTWYRFLTYGFVHSDTMIQHILFNMLGLFVFGRPVEQRLGRNEYLRFYLAAVVVGGLIYSLRSVIYALAIGTDVGSLNPGAVGASGAVMAVTILFAFFYPDATILLMAVFPVKAWVAAIGFVLMNLIGLVTSADYVAYDIHLAGAGFAALYHRLQLNLGDYTPTTMLSSLQRGFKRKPKLRLHNPDSSLAKEEAEADRILAKISASGMDSLTRAERKTLERHSRRKRADRARYDE